MYISKLLPKKTLFRILFLFNFPRIFFSNSKKLSTFYPLFTGKFIEENGFVLSNYGVWLKNNSPDKTFFLNVLGYRNQLEFFLEQIRKPFTFIDIGANQGIFSLVASRNKFCKQVHLFEPNRNIVEILNSNLKYNEVSNYQIHKFAISNTSGFVHFHIPSNHSGGARIIDSPSDNNYCESVNRFYLNELEIAPNCDVFLKIDVEGSEHYVLEEIFNSTLKDKIKFVFIEMNEAYGNCQKSHDILSKYRFSVRHRTAGKISFDALYIRNSY
jgi:FkbM family methyltransferase